VSHWIINGRHTVKKLLKKLHWAIKRKQIEEGLMAYCKLEYSKGEASYAFNKVLAMHKSAFINEGSVK
jgi:hypothetical protein